MRPGVLRQALLAVPALLAAGCAGPGGPVGSALRVEPLWQVRGALSTDQREAQVRGHLALARQYAGQLRWPLAADACRQALLLDPGNIEALNLLGQAEALQQRTAPAVAALEQAVAQAPERVDLLNNLGYALLLDGQRERSAAAFEQALALTPDYAAARANLQALAAPPVAAEPASPVPLQLVTEPSVPPLAVAPVADPAPARLPAPVVAAEPPAPPPPVAPGAAALRPRIVVVNGNGVPGAARRWSLRLGSLAHGSLRLANLRPYATAVTAVRYRAGFEQQAREVARLMKLPCTVSEAVDATADVRVTLGRDAGAGPQKA